MPGVYTVYSFVKQSYIDPSGEIAAFCDSTGYYLPLLCVTNLANGYINVLEQFDLNHMAFNEIIKETNAGNQGKLLIPWYEGERTPDVPLASPIYFGFGLKDFNKENLCRAILEGHVLNLFDGFRKMPVEVKEIRLTGGLSKSEAWCQAIADIFEAETVPVEGEGAALGAALHAKWVWQKENGDQTSIAEVIRPFILLDEKTRKKPLKQNIETYRIQKKLFNTISKRIRGLKSDSDPFLLRNLL